MNNKKPRGNIDFVKDGFVQGWAVAAHDITQPNLCKLLIDSKLITTFEASSFREDLKAESIRGGIAGFSQAIPLCFCDDKEHTISIQAHDSELIIGSKTIKIPKNKNLVTLDENIVFDHINTQYNNQQKVLFLAGFTNQKKLLTYQKHFVREFQKAGIYVVYAIASDQPSNLTETLNCADRVIIRDNIGYDFGSWAVLFQLCQNEFFGAKEVIFANDSIVGPIGSVDTLISRIDQCSADIWAITDSRDIKYHFQSYFWGIKKQANHFFPLIDAFFFYRHCLPNNKNEAISNFELEAMSFFKDNNLKVDILFPECKLISISEQMFTQSLKIHCKNWKALFELPLAKKDIHKLNSSIFEMSSLLINRSVTNPSHSYWNALIEDGFPFIKRELLTLNPTKYPFPSQFRKAFIENNTENLLDDMASSLTFNQAI